MYGFAAQSPGLVNVLAAGGIPVQGSASGTPKARLVTVYPADSLDAHMLVKSWSFAQNPKYPISQAPFIVLQATTVRVTGSLQAYGGNGGAGGSGGKDYFNRDAGAYDGYPGAGGSGGRIAVISPNAVQGVTPSNGTNASGSTRGTPTIAIQQVAACTPTISGIQVNGQVTNTIIAGTKGYVSMYGSCLSGARSVQAEGSGVTFTTVSYTADGQINASFEAAFSATGGAHNVTATTINSTSATSSVAQVFVTTVTLQSFSFGGSVEYWRDCAGNA